MISDWIDLVNCIDLPDQVHRIDLSNPGHCEGVLGVSECAAIRNDLKYAESLIDNEPSIQSTSIHQLEEKQKELEDKQKELEDKQKELEDKQKESEDKQKELEEKQKGLEEKQKGLEDKQKELEDKPKELEKAQNATDAGALAIFVATGVIVFFIGLTIGAMVSSY